ncbi:hypothetical protein Leryth_014682 [Lithospermum erythrorhizon]|nr:hypothetical protein Leryth_014682 [Lithospermum erythrorhizon]
MKCWTKGACPVTTRGNSYCTFISKFQDTSLAFCLWNSVVITFLSITEADATCFAGGGES